MSQNSNSSDVVLVFNNVEGATAYKQAYKLEVKSTKCSPDTLARVAHGATISVGVEKSPFRLRGLAPGESYELQVISEVWGIPVRAFSSAMVTVPVNARRTAGIAASSNFDACKAAPSTSPSTFSTSPSTLSTADSTDDTYTATSRGAHEQLGR